MTQNTIELHQITKQFKCPKCGHIAEYSGRPNERVIVTCASCDNKGTITLPETASSPQFTNGNAIEISHLKKMFGDFTAVDDVSFFVKKGEIFGLLGPNGAGKSTIIRMLCTLSRPTNGSATVAGFDVVKQASKVRQHIGLVSEKMIMYDELTARENLKLFGNLYNIPKDALDKRIDELLRFVRMEKWADERIKTFSTGMKQRINVIRALVNQPEILFLDEPTLGLDPQSGTDVSTFEIEISNLNPRIMSSIQSLSSVKSLVQEDTMHLLVRANGGDAFDTIIDSLRKNGAKVRMVKNLEPSLEDVFLHLTGREARDKVSENNASSKGSGHGPRRRRASRIR